MMMSGLSPAASMASFNTTAPSGSSAALPPARTNYTAKCGVDEDTLLRLRFWTSRGSAQGGYEKVMLAETPRGKNPIRPGLSGGLGVTCSWRKRAGIVNCLELVNADPNAQDRVRCLLGGVCELLARGLLLARSARMKL